MKMRTICQNCDAILVGRSDKKFCNDLCRSTFNNSRRRKPLKSYNKNNSLPEKIEDVNAKETALINEIIICSRRHGYILTSIQIQKLHDFNESRNFGNESEDIFQGD